MSLTTGDPDLFLKVERVRTCFGDMVILRFFVEIRFHLGQMDVCGSLHCDIHPKSVMRNHDLLLMPGEALFVRGKRAHCVCMAEPNKVTVSLQSVHVRDLCFYEVIIDLRSRSQLSLDDVMVSVLYVQMIQLRRYIISTQGVYVIIKCFIRDL